MSDSRLFQIGSAGAQELEGTSAVLEKSLQTLIERNLETFLGVRFLASEFVTSNGGRMDTLGIDENSCPVIIEYKRTRDENVTGSWTIAAISRYWCSVRWEQMRPGRSSGARLA